MTFTDWLLESEDMVREADPSEFPNYAMHASSEEAIANIRKTGFDLAMTGKASRKLRAPKELTQYDPKAIFVTPLDSPDQWVPEQPHIKMRLFITKAIWTPSKQALSQAFGNKTSARLTQALLKAGYQIVLTPSEAMILDTRIVVFI